jgi:hypothetical protein
VDIEWHVQSVEGSVDEGDEVRTQRRVSLQRFVPSANLSRASWARWPWTIFGSRIPDGIVTCVDELGSHTACELRQFAGKNFKGSGLSQSNLANPKPAKPHTMPGYNPFRLNEQQGRTPIAPETGQSNPKNAIGWGLVSGAS